MIVPANFIEGCDIPQADNLQRVRKVIDVVAQGVSNADKIADKTKITPRHVAYQLNAAKVLGFVTRGDGFFPTEQGLALAATPVDSEAERACIREAYERSEVLRRLAPGLFSKRAPSLSAIADRIEEFGRLSRATAERRAQTLLSWRTQVLDAQPSLQPASK
jgi:hypothetical protein